MGSIPYEKFRRVPFKHQKDGVRFLLDRPVAALFDEQGVGKSYQVINAACVLHSEGQISALVITCPAMCKSVWLDEDLGEIDKYCWTPALVHDYQAERGGPELPPGEKGVLTIIVCSFEFLRNEVWRKKLDRWMAARRTWHVADESIFIKNHRAVQAKAMKKLAMSSNRRTILNGTPVSQGQWDLYSQFEFLDPKILGFKNFYVFRNRHCVLGGFQKRKIVSFIREEEFQRKIQPYILRREKKDVLDLLPKMFTHRTVALKPETWNIYKQMRDEMVVWMSEDSASLASHAAVKTLRLSQITSGWLGGLEELGDKLPAVQIGTEKADLVTDYVEEMMRNKNRFLLWCRFRPEIEYLTRRISALGLETVNLWGLQPDREREHAKKLFESDHAGKVVMIGQPQAGGFGLTFVRNNQVGYASNDTNLLTRSQSEDRCHRAGQLNQVLYADFIATGPKGQRTMDHAHVVALQKKQDMATWTMRDWRKALEE